MDDEDDLPPLKITCHSTDCGNGLHCFLRTERQRAKVHAGSCRACGEQLVDMDRIHQHSLDDVEHTFAALKRERIRHHYWHSPIDQKASNHARRKGRSGMQEAAEKRIRSSVGKAGTENAFDGRQTPRAGNVLFYGQHAVAACCRKCIEEWHGISRDRRLTEEEVTYLTALVLMYVDHRLPNLPEVGEKVPPMRSPAIQPRARDRNPDVVKPSAIAPAGSEIRRGASEIDVEVAQTAQEESVESDVSPIRDRPTSFLPEFGHLTEKAVQKTFDGVGWAIQAPAEVPRVIVGSELDIVREDHGQAPT